jgi:hypothetical protein
MRMEGELLNAKNLVGKRKGKLGDRLKKNSRWSRCRKQIY